MNNIQSLLCDHICLCCWLTLEHATCVAITTSLCPTQPLTTAEQLTAHRGSPWGHCSHPQTKACPPVPCAPFHAQGDPTTTCPHCPIPLSCSALLLSMA